MGNREPLDWKAFEEQGALLRLRWRWAAFAALGLGALLGGYSLLRSGLAGGEFASQAAAWALVAGLSLLHILRLVWLALEDNRRTPESPLLSSLGPGNLLTLLRGLCIALLVPFLFLPRPEGWLLWAPAILFTIADLTDYFDGYAARISGYATRLGERLDLQFDSLLVLVGASLVVLYGQAPAWYLLVALARYLFVLGIWLRQRLGKPVFELPYHSSRRALAGVQMGFMAFILYPVFSPPGTHIAAAVFALPFLVGFFKDWLLVSGTLRSDHLSLPGFTRWLPFALRLGVGMVGAALLAQRLADLPQQVSLYAARGLPAAGLLLPLVSVLQGLAVLLIILGISGRITSIGGLLLVGLLQAFNPLGPGEAALVIGFTALLFLGTGPLSLWRPEEYWIHHRAGERRLANSELNGAGGGL